jgi:hypothetical protein
MRRPGGVVAALLVTAVAGACANTSKPAATINDPVFVRQANAVCRPAVPKLRAPDRKATSTTQLRASTIDGTADGVAAVAAELKQLPVRSQDRARVKAWLADWDRFVAVGHQYAAAVKADDPERYTRIDDQAVDLAERIGRFAKGNGIDDCIL